MSRVGQTAPDSALGEPNHGIMDTGPVTLSRYPMHFPRSAKNGQGTRDKGRIDSKPKEATAILADDNRTGRI